MALVLGILITSTTENEPHKNADQEQFEIQKKKHDREFVAWKCNVHAVVSISNKTCITIIKPSFLRIWIALKKEKRKIFKHYLW